jgi:Family of unknown function (DUF6204)
VTLQIFRVIVRGKFDGLDDATRVELLAAATEHDVTRAAFRADGTFTYDTRLVAFSFRYELRDDGDDPEHAVVDRARAMAEASLVGLGVGYRDLRIEAINMADVWRR